MPIYEYNGKRYNIPEEKVQELITRMPGATLVGHDAPDRESNPPAPEQQAPQQQATVAQTAQEPARSINIPRVNTSTFDREIAKQTAAKGQEPFANIGRDQNVAEIFGDMYNKGQLKRAVPQNAAQQQEGFWATRVGDFFEKVASGAVNLAGGFAKVHENTNPFMLAARKIAGALQAEEGTSIKDAEMAQDLIPKALLAKGKELSERGDRYGNLEDPETGEIRKKTYSDLWKEGRKGAAVEEALLTASESIPTSLMAFAPGGLGLIAITVAGQKYEELDSNPETKELPEWKKILNASLSGVIEGATEKLGAKVDVKLFEPFMKKMTEKTVKQILAKGGINALIQALSEGAEEVVSQLGGNVVDYATDVSDTYKPFEGVKDSFVYGAAGGAQFGGVTGVGTIYRAAEAAGINRNIKRADTEAGKYIDGWQGWKEQLNAMFADERVQAIQDIESNPDISEEGKKAAKQYITATSYRDAKIGELQEQHKADVETAKAQNTLRLWESINNKQSQALPALNKEKQDLEAELGDLTTLSFEEVAISPEATPELVEARRRYDIVNAEYEGVMEKLKTEVDEFIAPQIKAMQDVAKDGVITELNVGTEDAPDIVYLIKGDVAINEDGTIDPAATSPMLTVKNSEGKKRMIARSKIVTAQQDNLNATIEGIKQRAYEKLVRPVADKMEGKTHFQNGDKVEYTNSKGETVAGTVTAKQGNTVTVVGIDGKKTETFTEDELAQRRIGEMIDDVKTRDVIQVEMNGQVYDADVTNIQDGIAELYIPSFPEANGRYQDVTAEELRKIRVVPQPETIKKTEEEVKSEGNVPEQVEQNDSKTPGTEANSQVTPEQQAEAEIEERRANDLIKKFNAEAEAQITPEQQAEVEKQQFLESLPVVESGKRKGQIDQSQMTPDQNIKFFEYQYGQDKAIEASQKMVQNLNKKIVSEQKKLDNDPFNIELNENIQAMQSQLQTYKSYADEQAIAKTKKNMQEAPKSSVLKDREQKAEAIQQQEAGRTGIADQAIKDKWESSQKADGVEDVITLANGEKIAGRYVLTTAEAPSPSHDIDKNFAKTVGFPVNELGNTVNDRDYEADKTAQVLVQQRANNYDERAVQTPVVVSADGIVLSGNDRTMAGKIAARNGTDKAYVDYITKYADRWGFTPEQVANMESPRIVFIPDAPMPYNTTTFAKFNAEEKKTQNTLEKAIKSSKSVSRDIVIPIADVIDEFKNLSNFYADSKATKKVIYVLTRNNIVQNNELPGLMDGDLLSAEGRSYLETLMLGAVLQEQALREVDAMRSVRQTLMRIMPQLVRNASLNEYTLINELNNSIHLLYQSKQSGSTVKVQLRQTNLFEASASEIYAETEKTLAFMLEEAKDTEIRAIFESYNKEAIDIESGQANMFDGLMTKPELLTLILDKYGRQAESTQQTKSSSQSDGESEGNRSGQPTESRSGQPKGQQPGSIEAEAAKVDVKPKEDEKPQGKEAKDSIRKLGTGSNVYFDSNGIRVNDYQNGKVLMNVDSREDFGGPAFWNIEFDTPDEAVKIANELAKIYPNGVPQAVLLDRVVKDMQSKGAEVKPKTDYGANNKIITTDRLEKEAEDALNDFLDAFNDLNSDNLGIVDNTAEKQARMLVAGTKMVGAYTKLGVFKFAELVNTIAQRGIQITEDLLSAIKKAYGAFAAENDIDELDDMRTVRSFRLEDVNTAAGNYEQPTTKTKQNEQGTRSTEAIEAETETIESASDVIRSESENVGSDQQRAGDVKEQADEQVKKVETLLIEVEQKLANLKLSGKNYSTDGIAADYPINVLAKGPIKKDATAYVKAVAKMTGLEHDTDRKGKREILDVNIAPAGGNVTFVLWSKKNPDYGVYVSVPYSPDSRNEYDNYKVDGSILWRVTTKQDKWTGLSNQYVNSDVTAQEMAETLLKGLNQELRSRGLEQEINQVEKAPETVKNKRINKKTSAKVAKNQTNMLSLFGEEDDVSPTKNDQDDKPGRRNEEANNSLGERERKETGRTEQGGLDRGDVAHNGVDREGSRRISGLPDNAEELHVKNTNNNRNERGVDYSPKSPKARFNANIAAINLMRKLNDSGITVPTREQMDVLRKYSGWGGLGTYFNNDSNENRTLRALLSAEEYQDANDSVRSAYYTPADVIDSLWDIAKRLGFKGGNILESSAGIGSILGYMPKSISDKSNIEGVEIDAVSGEILKLLYPDAKIHVQGFEDTSIRNGSVDLAITNVPFVTGLNVHDPIDKDLSRKFKNIHDFVIAKNIRKIKEGGIGIFITTKGTMDSSKKLREWIGTDGSSDVIGAFRLNNETFESTGVTSDIIVVRKRVAGKIYDGAIDIINTTIVRSEEYETEAGEWVRGKGYVKEVKQVDLIYNKYFADNPQFMGGEMAFGFEHGDTYRPESISLFPKNGVNQKERLSQWVDQFDEIKGIARINETAKEREVEATTIKEGQLFIDSKGNIAISSRGLAEDPEINNNKVKGRTKKEVLNDYNAIKESVDALLKYQVDNQNDSGLKPLLDKLNKSYDSFVSKYGQLNNNVSLAWLRKDVDFPAIAALEKYSEKKTIDGKKIIKVNKTLVFTQRVIGYKSKPAPKNIKDAVIASVYEYNDINIPYISEALSIDEDSAREKILNEELGFSNPQTGAIEIRHRYLSGNVREKLKVAKDSNVNGEYDANIRELEKVIPMDIPTHLIDITIGSTWVPPSVFERYFMDRYGVRLKLQQTEGSWVIQPASKSGQYTDKNRQLGVYSKMFNETVMGDELAYAAMNNRNVVFKKIRKNSDGSQETITDKEATAEATRRISEIKGDFVDWVKDYLKTNEELSDNIMNMYNDKFNAIVPISIDEKFIPERFDGAATFINLYTHQKKAAIRATMQPIMLAHEVGTGKTFTLITAAMEMRRVGTAKKPMIVVQNATIGQFVTEAKTLYPNAKILALSDSDRNKKGRLAFYANIKYNDWDMVVIPQSTFDMIPDSPERQNAFIHEKIDEKIRVIEAMKDTDADSRMVKQMENQLDDLYAELAGRGKKKNKKSKDKSKGIAVDNAATRAKAQLDRRTDDVQYFDDLGVDALLIDEAHAYKKLGYETTMARGVKGIDTSRSKRAAGLYIKSRAILEKSGWKNFVLATGTPITNTAAELWTFMRFLLKKETLIENDMYYFDDFAKNFGSIDQMLEFATSGKYKENTRFAKYINLAELVRIWASVSDTVLTKDASYVNDKVPDMETGKAQDVYLEQSDTLVDIMRAVRKRLDEFDKMTGKEKKENNYIPIVMYGIAKRAAIDTRLIDKNSPDEPLSKTNKTVDEVLRSLEDTKAYNGTVAVFCDSQNRKDDGVITFNIFEDIKQKLINKGVPENQIVIMKSGMNIKQKQKIFADVNEGTSRVIMGSTETLGTGVNIQERLHTLIHMDAPDLPMQYTQRMGRILRQGNLHKEWNKPVRVLRFGVVDSLDVTAYQRLQTKSNIINSVMDGKTVMANAMENRSIEETSDTGFGNTVAQLSGSQYALLKDHAEKELQKLLGKRKQHEYDQIYIANQTRRNSGIIRANESIIKDSKDRLNKIRSFFPEGKAKSLSIAGKKIEGNISIEEALKEYVNKPVNEFVENSRKNTSFKSSILPFEVKADNVTFIINVKITRDSAYDERAKGLRISMRRNISYASEQLNMDDVPVSGAYAREAINDIIENVIPGKDDSDRIEHVERAIKRLNDENESMNARKGKEFDLNDELEEAEKKVEEYTVLMQKELEEKEKKYQERGSGKNVDVETIELEDEDQADDEDILYRSVDESGFYSTVEDALEKIKQEKGTPEQFKAMLLKNGAKQAELDWMGWDDFASDINVVTKTDIQDWIEANRIEVEEVKADKAESEIEESTRYIESDADDYVSEHAMDVEIESDTETREKFKVDEPIFLENGYYRGDAAEDALTEIAKEQGYEDYDEMFVDMDRHYNELKDSKERQLRQEYINKHSSGRAHKYSAYQLTGGENYKELLLTMPYTASINREEVSNRVDSINAELEELRGKGHSAERISELLNERDRLITELNNEAKSGFKSSHFDEPNILAHIRFNERTVNGERVLFIEEIQSDWAQKGKKEGFKSDKDKLFKELESKGIYQDKKSSLQTSFIDKDGNQIYHPNSNVEQNATSEQDAAIDEFFKEYQRLSNASAPDMPFKKTDQWVNLALRRMMMYAAENDYDRIAWTTGEQQAERYNLSKQVDWIEYGKNENGTYWFALPVEYSKPTELTEQELESYVGKDITKKMIDGEGIDGEYGGKRLQGNDLKVGGSGMIAFYDRIVPKAAKKLSKPFGANVETVNIPEIGQQQSIPITDALRELAPNGMPLFRKRDTEAREAYAMREWKRAENAVNRLAKKMGVEVELLETTEGLPKKKRESKGWYDVKAKKITIVMPNHRNSMDVQATLLHEAVGHHGLRELFGEHFDTFLDNVYNNAEDSIKQAINDISETSKIDIRTATEEYLSKLAEDREVEVSDRYGSNSFLNNVRMFFFGMLAKVGFNPGFKLSDNELKYILWRSYNNLVEPGRYKSIAELAKDIAMQDRLKVGNYAERGTRANVVEEPVTTVINAAKHLESDGAQEYTELNENEIPENTQVAYKLMRYMPSKPGMLFPLYAKDDDAGRKGFKKGKWYKAEVQSVKIGGNDLANRPGIHAVNLPLFLQGKVNVKGETRVWAKVLMPAMNKETQAENDASPILSNGQREGIRGRLIGANEAYNFKTNPSATGADAWPIAGSMKIVEVISDKQVEQILRDNGKELFIDLSLTGDPDIRFRTIGEEVKRADDLFDNIDNLKSVVKDYGGFLGKVFDGAPNRGDMLAYARENGFDKLGEGIEQYLADVEDPAELSRIKELLGVDMPDNALRYMLWRNANPDDGTVVWKAKEAVKTNELDENILFRKGEVPSSIKNDKYEQRIRSRHNRGFRSLMYGIEEGWFDRMASLRILQNAITGGKAVPDKANAYMLENQLTSRNTSDIRYYTKNLIDPFVKQIHDIFGRNMNAADEYMNAKHGLERNDLMAEEEAKRKYAKNIAALNKEYADEKIDEDTYNEKMEALNGKIEAYAEKLKEEKDYSGLTAIAAERGREDFKAVAQEIVAEIEGGVPKEDIDALWSRVNSATKWILDKQYNAGIMTKDIYDKIRGMYNYYVPLRGFEEVTATDLYEYIDNSPSNFEGTVKKAYGRTSKAESPTATIMSMGESGIMQANRNRMKQAFYRLVATNPSNYASIEDVWFVETADGFEERFPDISPTASADEVLEAIADFNNEMAELAAEGKAFQGRNKLDVGVKIMKAQASEHVIRVWIAGEEKVIFINGNPRVAQAINGLVQKDLLNKDNLRHGVHYWSRQMAANFTSRNPAFMVTNLMRDVQFAVVSAAVKEGVPYSTKLAKNVFLVGKTISANVFKDGNKDNAEFQKYWEEFEANGGETGYANLHSIDFNRKYVNKKLREFSDQRDFLKPFRAWVRFMENGNRMIEDMSRFATYVTSRQMGRSIERSVSDAKEITINFNRKGSGGFGANLIHSFYLFSNPALQSMRLMGMLAKNHRVKFTAMLSTTMAAGFMVPMINELLLGLFGDDDDKEKYQNITPWVRRNNLVLYVPWTDGKFITLMLPHELRAFYGIGEMAYEKANGGLRRENMAVETAKQMTAMLPIDPMGGPDWWVPDALKPPYQAYVTNRNFMDSPIYRDNQWNKFDPEWTKAYKSTPEFLVEAAKGASDMTGGDDVVPGWANPNPARAYHLFSGYLGGFMTTYTDLSMIGFNLLTGREVRQNDIPVVNKLIRTSDEKTKELRINSEYFYYIDWMRAYEHKAKGYEKRVQDPEYRDKYVDIMRDKEQRMYNYAKGQIALIDQLKEYDEAKANEMKEQFVRNMWKYEDQD